MATLRPLQHFAFLALLVSLTGCGAPIFRSHEERFAPAPEVIEELQPYLEKWATTPPEQTRTEREEVAANSDNVVAIYTEGERITAKGEEIYILVIRLGGWEDWERGYFYVHDGSELVENSNLQLQQVDKHFYIYNRNI